jgi:hypothetical protein
VVDQVTKLRIITDHTYPFGKGISSNDGTDPALAHLPEMRLSSGVAYARTVGVFASAGVALMMWKRDAKAAYRQVPVCPSDFWKCGCVAGQGLLVDTRLSFGVRMAPNKFQRLMLVAAREVMARIHAFDERHPPDDQTLLRWLDARRKAMGDEQARLAAIIQYIDDGLAVSMNDVVPGTGRGRAFFHMDIYDEVMEEAGIEMAGGDKRYESPCEIEALGVWVDLADGSVSYPESKRLRLTAFIQGLCSSWPNRAHHCSEPQSSPWWVRRSGSPMLPRASPPTSPQPLRWHTRGGDRPLW